MFLVIIISFTKGRELSPVHAVTVVCDGPAFRWKSLQIAICNSQFKLGDSEIHYCLLLNNVMLEK